MWVRCSIYGWPSLPPLSTQPPLLLLPPPPLATYLCVMDRRRIKQQRIARCDSEEVSSIEWEYIHMTEQEEDLVYRMHRLVGDRWPLIAGRIPGRTAQEIERFWIMRHNQDFAYKRKKFQD